MPPTHLDSFVPPPPVGRRAEVLAGLTRAIVEQESSRRLVIAIDGVDGAGKTVLALELADMLAPHREVSRASIDGFHHPRAQRYARGRTAESFYRDSYDHGAIRTLLVEPQAVLGGMMSAALLSMFVVPAVYLLMRRRRESPAIQHVAEASHAR